MVGILQFLDFGQAISSLKLSALKRHNDGVEAPRNSLEFPTEASQSYQVIHEDIPVEYHSSKVDVCPLEAPIKWLSNDETTIRSKERCIRPNLVARLMGVDTLPSEMKPMAHAKERKNEKKLTREANEVVSTQHPSLISRSMKQQKKEILPCAVQQSFRQHKQRQLSSKPQPREHPQQELLQRFKKDFEAWQASRVWENARTLQLEYEPRNDCKWRNDVAPSAQEKFKGEKALGFMNAKKCSVVKKTVEPGDHISSAKQKIDRKKVHLKCEGCINKENRSITASNGTYLKDRTISNSILLSTEGKERKSIPRRIVIVQPSIEMSNETEKSWLPSPERVGKEINMQDFLGQVKKKLEFEIQGKARFDVPTRWTDNDTFSNQSSYGSKQYKENAVVDYNTTLMRSTSKRFYESELQLNEQKSPHLINKGTRKSLSERLRNVLKDEPDAQFPLLVNERSTLSRKEEEMFKPIHYLIEKSKDVSYCKEYKVIDERNIRSSRHDCCHDVTSNDEEVSSRKLVRSFSAPMATTAFETIFSKDKHVKTAACTNGKHEASESESTEARKVRKDSFNIKSKVSCLRQNLTFKGKLFGKKMQLMDETAANETPFMEATLTAHCAIMNLGFSQDNLTEVPPSPASVCSSSYDYHRPGYPSPVSPLEAPFVEELSSSQVSGELTSNLRELDQAEMLTTEEPVEKAPKSMLISDKNLEAVDDTKSFIRDILVTSGLFNRQSINQIFPGWASLSKPISKWVFDKIEETYSNTRKSHQRESLSCNDHVEVSHRMLFDLLNEGLSKVVQTSAASSRLMEWLLGSRRVPLGNELLDNLWDQIQVLVKPPADGLYSLNYIMTWDFNRTPWSTTSQADIHVLGIEIELIILGEMIDEFVFDLCS